MNTDQLDFFGQCQEAPQAPAITKQRVALCQDVDKLMEISAYTYDLDSDAFRAYCIQRGQRVLNDKSPFIWWLYDAYRVTREGGCLVCFTRWDVQETWRYAITLAGWQVKSQVIWDREVHGMGDTKAAFAPRHDVIWFAVKGRFQFPGKRPASVISEQRLISSLVHPTQKPVALMERLTKAVTPEGGVVLDPCMGSGSTRVAAVQ